MLIHEYSLVYVSLAWNTKEIPLILLTFKITISCISINSFISLKNLYLRGDSNWLIITTYLVAFLCTWKITYSFLLLQSDITLFDTISFKLMISYIMFLSIPLLCIYKPIIIYSYSNGMYTFSNWLSLLVFVDHIILNSMISFTVIIKND